MNVALATYNTSPAVALPMLASVSVNPLRLNQYQVKFINIAANEDNVVAKADAVSWSAYQTVMTILLTIAIAVVGSGFAWIRSDVADIRVDVREIRNSTSNTEKQFVGLNAKLDTFIEDGRRRR